MIKTKSESCIFTFDDWDKTEVEKTHASLLKQYLGLNRSTQNKLVRSEFGRFPLFTLHIPILDAHTRTQSYMKYLKNKSDDSLAKISYELQSSLENNDSLFVNCDKIYHEISEKNVKKESDPYKSGKSKFKFFIQNYYIVWWKIQLRGASTSASFAMHKNSYSLEPYLSVITIKKTQKCSCKTQALRPQTQNSLWPPDKTYHPTGASLLFILSQHC